MIILKIGGNILNKPDALAAALDYFAALEGPAVLVHGGGRKASEVIAAMGMEPKMIDGRRITDAATLEIVTMVYGGLINKQVVADLQARGRNAIGLSGADGNAVLAEKRPVKTIDYGFAGDVLGADGSLLWQLLDAGLTPVMCPITHNGKGQLLNTNADTIANETAIAVARARPEEQVSLRYCFEFPGVMHDIKDPESWIPELQPSSYAAFKAAGTIVGGMIPKLDNAFAAVAAGVGEVIIGDLPALQAGKGTRIIGGS
ncbi:acetylglutamate kinase [Neolewinella aurantiaca]|uniref:Acetylglutamate kinase n=1 Tax=Neolewinella aurantiaca TaxID=2602767 RepID=A0A5C7FKI1_9BACT|nr:acetylglutamate kinase [Neolewinella aurantiaca]TXF91193.1 acetylglutamate kinase [Neolewinella aurantiaca]